MGKNFPQMEIQTRASLAVLTSEKKKDFKLKPVKREKEGHYIMIKGPIHQEDITFVNTYAHWST